MRFPFYLSGPEAEWLLTRLGDDPMRLRRALNHIVVQDQDAAEKLRELTARHRANQHWIDDPPDLPKHGSSQPAKHVATIIANIDRINPADRAALLKMLTGD